MAETEDTVEADVLDLGNALIDSEPDGAPGSPLIRLQPAEVCLAPGGRRGTAPPRRNCSAGVRG
jgi:hypothetical protein